MCVCVCVCVCVCPCVCACVRVCARARVCVTKAHLALIKREPLSVLQKGHSFLHPLYPYRERKERMGKNLTPPSPTHTHTYTPPTSSARSHDHTKQTITAGKEREEEEEKKGGHSSKNFRHIGQEDEDETRAVSLPLDRERCG